jgi:hypothetical protein
VSVDPPGVELDPSRRESRRINVRRALGGVGLSFFIVALGVACFPLPPFGPVLTISLLIALVIHWRRDGRTGRARGRRLALGERLLWLPNDLLSTVLVLVPLPLLAGIAWTGWQLLRLLSAALSSEPVTATPSLVQEELDWCFHVITLVLLVASAPGCLRSAWRLLVAPEVPDDDPPLPSLDRSPADTSWRERVNHRRFLRGLLLSTIVIAAVVQLTLVLPFLRILLAPLAIVGLAIQYRLDRRHYRKHGWRLPLSGMLVAFGDGVVASLLTVAGLMIGFVVFLFLLIEYLSR